MAFHGVISRLLSALTKLIHYYCIYFHLVIRANHEIMLWASWCSFIYYPYTQHLNIPSGVIFKMSQRKCHFDEICVTGCTESGHCDNYLCRHWRKFRQKDDFSVSVFDYTTCNNRGGYICWKCFIWYINEMSLVWNTHCYQHVYESMHHAVKNTRLSTGR